MNPAIDKAAEWIAEQVRRNQYAEIVIRVVVHDGEVRQIERQVCEKIRNEK